MNFFAHATLAREQDASPAFALGAMLPDFVGMLGIQTPAGVDDAVRRGMAHHHRTDGAFHYSRGFGALMAQGVGLLKERGVERGRARGAGHVGIEILLDGVLALTEGSQSHYYAALSVGSAQCAKWHWQSAGDAARIDDLCQRLAARSIRADSWDPERVAWRVERALSARPRFVLSGTDVGQIEAWASDYRPRVQESAPALLDEVRHALEP